MDEEEREKKSRTNGDSWRGREREGEGSVGGTGRDGKESNVRRTVPDDDTCERNKSSQQAKRGDASKRDEREKDGLFRLIGCFKCLFPSTTAAPKMGRYCRRVIHVRN